MSDEMKDVEKKDGAPASGSGDAKKSTNYGLYIAAGVVLVLIVFLLGVLISVISNMDKDDTSETTMAQSVNTTTAAPTKSDEAAETTAGSDNESASQSPSQSETTAPVQNGTTAPAQNESSAEPTQSESPSTEPSKPPVNNGELAATVAKTGSWGENPVFTQLTINVTNGSASTISGWTLYVNVGSGAAIDQGWSGTYSLEGDTLKVMNVDYNGTLNPGQTCELGLIMTGVSGDLSVSAEAGSTVEAPTYDNNQNNNNNNQNNNQNNNNNNQNQPAANPGALPVPEATTNDWLHVEGTKIVDANGKEVWLTGCNWFGYNTGTNTFDGLWNSDLNTSIKGIADHGFNLIRVPISTELILQWKNGQAPTANFNQATNAYLVGKDSLEIFDYVIGQCRANGLKIMIDIHCAKTDASGHNVNLWYTDAISFADYQDALVWMAERYKNDDTIIAYDLENEPHGKPYEGSGAAIWNDSKDANNWKYAAEDTALKILAVHPNVLIMVEGIEIYPIDIKTNGDFHSKDEKDYHFNWWGGNLMGVADYPINLGQYQSQLVYSPHDYGPTVYEQPWFKGSYDYDSLMKDCWHDNWFYIYEDGIAPLLIGEWGGFMREPNLTWMTYCRELIKKYRLNHTFWCFNANSGDTGGLVLDDFTTWDVEKYEFVKEALWQENGKFVGLDHDIPLGTAGNGIALGELK